jgi:hypothetical protein
MTMQANGGSRADRPRRVVASFTRYADAERAVDRLSDSGFPVDRVAIVGRDLHFVEQVTGRMTWGRAALDGALPGAFAGFLVGWLFGLFDWVDPIVASLWLAFHGIWIGALFGALVGLATHALHGGRRDFGSVSGMRAERYDVLVDQEVADQAAQLLGDGARAATEVPDMTRSTIPG